MSLAFALLLSAVADPVRVADADALRAALRSARPGTVILVAPGTYAGGHRLERLAGTEASPIVLRGADPERPPLFTGGGASAFHLVSCERVTLANLVVRGYPGNGVNVDDGGSVETPSRHVTLERLVIEDTGPRGNHDALKLSGVAGFTVRDCRFSGWGGSAIDMVGCRDGLVERCRFEGKEGFTPSNAVQLKGGTRDVLVRTSWFKDCGERAVNLGGSTGLAYFRPKVGTYEATGIEIAGNRFSGCLSPVAWVTSDGGHVHHNTFHLPGKWVLRILQETQDARFRPCRGGVFEDNVVVYDGSVAVPVNVGPGTAPETFVFRRNAWFRAGDRRPPALPAPEEGGVHGVDPQLEDAGGPSMKVTSKDPRLRGLGAEGYREGK